MERVEIKDVRLPVQLQRAMAAEAEAAREARAKVIAAEGEKTASIALRAASDVIANNQAAMQLRYLQVNFTKQSSSKPSHPFHPPRHAKCRTTALTSKVLFAVRANLKIFLAS